MKASELQGTLLDCWVACALNPAERVFLNQDGYTLRWHYKPKPYCTDWAYGGPIVGSLVNFGYTFMRTDATGPVRSLNAWGAMDGKDLLECALRTYVRMKFGDEISAPTQ